MSLHVGADIGGTFTDLVFLDENGRLDRRKVPTTPDNYARAIIEGTLGFCRDRKLGPEQVREVAHATTVATNAILERKGAKTALITTEGFRDVLELRRIRIPLSYDLGWQKPEPLVERALRFTVRERIGARGDVLEPLDPASLEMVIAALREEPVEAVAVCLLHSYRQPEHERQIGAALRKAFPDLYISLSHDVIPEMLEFERTSTTVVNAYVAPLIGRYLRALTEELKQSRIEAPILVMQSNGGLIRAEAAIQRPVTIIESGPAAGVVAAAEIAARCGVSNLITLDMGGTTTKASIIENGEMLRASEYEVGAAISVSSRLVRGGGYLLRMPVVDISEVGAGGGSIAGLDPSGALRVGPRSAGAVPGPACYGKGNTMPTVTDANVVLGYLGSGSLAGGSLTIDPELAKKAVMDAVATPGGMDLLAAAHGIHLVANSNMVRAIKSVSIERGRDPAEFVMMAFGGAGPIHAAGIAQTLGIKKVLIPPASGVFSSFGLIGAAIEHHAARTVLTDTRAVDFGVIAETFAAMRAEIAGRDREAAARLRFHAAIDLRYRGQSSELTIPLGEPTLDEAILRAGEERFEAEFERTYGHRGLTREFELVTLRLIGAAGRGLKHTGEWADTQVRAGNTRMCYFGPGHGAVETPIVTRDALMGSTRAGPLVVQEYDTTIVVPPDCSATCDANHNLVITIGGG